MREFVCPECGHDHASPAAMISRSPSDDPWSSVLRTQTCQRCRHAIPAHLGERWNSMSVAEARAEWRRVYRPGSEPSYPTVRDRPGHPENVVARWSYVAQLVDDGAALGIDRGGEEGGLGVASISVGGGRVCSFACGGMAWDEIMDRLEALARRYVTEGVVSNEVDD